MLLVVVRLRTRGVASIVWLVVVVVLGVLGVLLFVVHL